MQKHSAPGSQLHKTQLKSAVLSLFLIWLPYTQQAILIDNTYHIFGNDNLLAINVFSKYSHWNIISYHSRLNFSVIC